MKKYYETLEFSMIQKAIKNYCFSEMAKNQVDALKPYHDLDDLKLYQDDVFHAMTIIYAYGRIPLAPYEDIEEISGYLRQQLEERRREEIARRQACVGPHRDDIEFKINGLDAVKFASQGQQRTIVLSLKLSELEIIKAKTGFSPILLLDDVLAELDETRQNYLLKSIEDDTQTIITSVDTVLFEDEFLKDVIIYKIEAGRIAE